MALIRRRINLKFQLGQGDYGESGFDEVTVKDLRVQAEIVKAGGMALGESSIRVYGLKRSTMNKLATLGIEVDLQKRNIVTLIAGDDADGMATRFVGTIRSGWIDYQSAPEVAFVVSAQAGGFQAVKTSKPRSYGAATSASVILQGLATEMDVPFENNGVEVMLPAAYFYGSQLDQARDVVKQANINWNNLDGGRMVIWPKGGTSGGTIPLIAPPKMRGYPTWTSTGIMVQSLFERNVGIGGKIKVQSSDEKANGEWTVFRIDDSLDSEMPRGRWFTSMHANRPGNRPVRT